MCPEEDYSTVVDAIDDIGIEETKNHEYQPTKRVPESFLLDVVSLISAKVIRFCIFLAGVHLRGEKAQLLDSPWQDVWKRERETDVMLPSCYTLSLCHQTPIILCYGEYAAQ